MARGEDTGNHPKRQVGRESVVTRWVVQHHPGNEGYTISDNFTTEDAAQSFAERQTAKGRTIRSIKRDRQLPAGLLIQSLARSREPHTPVRTCAG